ncbi:unnamed protein product [Chrysodeixis includens]|uniref:Uncharacterized protein n=1 Tax=Chrysodeixis includens TaxID=689277 RepID=A0A9N8KVJ3_CHRIL|nr:unnamed protein product [Chrysodeixis includens]
MAKLLARYDKELEALRTNDKARLRRLLAKIRVYWPQSLAQQWTDAYLLNLNKAKGQKAAIKGLLMLMTQKQVIDMVEKHKPEDFKIKWGEINLTEINLRKYIAQHLHLARPFVPLETVLWYAEQDYLQYAVPSIYPMMSRMSKDLSRKCLVTLLEAPVSLQKFGIRFAFLKLQSDELVPIYSKIWLSTKNLTIRQMLFTRTFNVLCKTKNKTVKRELRELLIKMTLTVEGDTLGKKHEHFNKLVQEAVTNDNYELNQITYEDSDLDNLFKIDVACKTRNVDYIVEALKSNDMLMEVYTESENNVQICLKAIIIHKVIEEAKVPEIVERKFNFDTFRNSLNQLNKEHKEKLFSYLLNLVYEQIRNQTIESEIDFNTTVCHIDNALTLLIDWKRDINDYPFILEHIKNLAILKKDKLWDTNMSSIYSKKKSWRKYLFDDAFTFMLNEEVCLNALKHDSQLLTRHDKELDALRTNDKATLRRLLAKIRVYWPQSLAQQWTDAYLLNLNRTKGQKAAIKGLFMLMTQKQVIDMAEKHRPKDFKIKWGEVDVADINLRKYIAQHLHLARPLVPLETVLWYAMAPQDLDGETLGEKRKNYNKLLKEAIANNEAVPSFKLSESDVQNLFNIDLACHNRDVNYILEVFKCGDLLCVSRAIAQSTWLVTEQQYSNIINPEYIRKELYPYMNTKAFNKLHKHIRHNIKDEARAEQFYLQEFIMET